MKLYPVVILLFLASLCCVDSYSQNAKSDPVVTVRGEVTKPLTLHLADLAKMKRTTVSVKNHDNVPVSYTGVAVQDILDMAGATTGGQLRGKNLTKYLLVKCADGYQLVFSLAELDNSFTDRIVVLADESEGKPISDTTGPFHLAVPGEKKPARSGRQVTELVVKSALE